MKKSLFVATMAGLSLASCVSESTMDDIQGAEKVKIMFESPVMYNNAETRAVAGEITSGERSYPIEEDFKVYAIKHEQDFSGWGAENNSSYLWGSANAMTVHYNLDLNGWAPWDGSKFVDYYFDLGMKGSFAAYSPADASGTMSYGADGLTITDFTVEDKPVEQYDLMFSSRIVNQTHANQTWHGYAGIPINFHHALSSIRFALVGDEKAKLNGIKVNKVFSKATFKENITERSDEGTLLGYAINDGQNNGNVNPTWEELDVRKDYIVYENIDVAFSESPQFVLELIKKENSGYADAKNLLMIPQGLSKAGTDFDASEDPHLEIDYTDVNGESKQSLIPLSDFFEGKWKMGYRHIYILSLGGTSKIFFAPGVDSWKEISGDAVISLDNYVVTP